MFLSEIKTFSEMQQARVLLPVDLLLKKWKRKFFRQKGNDTRANIKFRN